MKVIGAVLVALALLSSCRSKQEIEYEQYFNQGQVLYTKHCSNCHQSNGKGLGLLYPPLDSSDFMQANFDSVVCIIRYGKTTPTVVNGKTYVQPMKGIPELTNLDIAEITTYIYNNWGGNRGQITTDEVGRAIGKCESSL